VWSKRRCAAVLLAKLCNATVRPNQEDGNFKMRQSSRQYSTLVCKYSIKQVAGARFGVAVLSM
jgi:hypothetical protein